MQFFDQMRVGNSKAALFLRTLHDQPKYAAFVKNLNITVLTRSVPVATRVAAAAYGVQRATTIPGFKPYLWEPNVAAMILGELSNLHSLELNLLDELPIDMGPGQIPIWKPADEMDPSLLLREEPRNSYETPDLRSIAGYSQLQRLSIHSQQWAIHWWPCLSNTCELSTVIWTCSHPLSHMISLKRQYHPSSSPSAADISAGLNWITSGRACRCSGPSSKVW